MVKDLPPMPETWVWSLGREGRLEKGMATHSSISCPANSMDGGAWWTTVHGVAQSQTWWSDTQQFTNVPRVRQAAAATCFLLSQGDGHTQPRPWTHVWHQALGARGQWHSLGDEEEHPSQAQKGTKGGVKPKWVGTAKAREDASRGQWIQTEAGSGPSSRTSFCVEHGTVPEGAEGCSEREAGIALWKAAAPLSPALISPAHDELHVWGPFTVDLLCWGLNTYLPSGASGSAAVFQVPDLRYDLQARTTYLVMNSEIPGM